MTPAQPSQVRRQLVHRSSGAAVGHAVLPRGTRGLEGLLLVPTSASGARAGEEVGVECPQSRLAAASLAASMIAELKRKMPEGVVVTKVEQDQGDMTTEIKPAVDRVRKNDHRDR